MIKVFVSILSPVCMASGLLSHIASTDARDDRRDAAPSREDRA